MSIKNKWLTGEERTDVDGIMNVIAVLEGRLRDLKGNKAGWLRRAIETAMRDLDRLYHSVEFLLEDIEAIEEAAKEYDRVRESK